ncbi:mitochondrial inner membrane protease subunit 2 isoform X3 [Bubalus kerabau]|uniref:mitochondrial inner membrane protease subunit 2 isoform X3 n=1 Tax=Bubalus carabanensis TaxID=3119969 RepID=UPI00244E8392|nr:mitochondrial inner membrane protease subunit 2 isoform X3 [Bubalus carabanensis]
MCACACLSEAPRGSGPGPLGPFLLPLTRGFGQIWRGHKITTYPFSPRKNGRKGMAQSQGWVRRYFKAFCKGFFVAVPVAVTFLDRVACVARVEGASMQPSLNPGGSQSSDVVLLNHWKVRNFEVQRGDIVSLVVYTWDRKLVLIAFGLPYLSAQEQPQELMDHKREICCLNNDYLLYLANKKRGKYNSSVTQHEKDMLKL